MSFAAWLEERVRYGSAEAFLRHKEVPRHRFAFTYYTGGITLFFFLVQVLTGLLLLMYYRPTADAAFESVRFIMSKVRFGWLIRDIHVWSANLMILAAAVHLAATFFGKAYRRPREVTWLTGVALLFLTLTFGFTGYLLPWNTLAYFATKVGTEIAGDVPLIGQWILVLLRGGEDVTEATLSRFFGIHVAILPALTTLLLGGHLLLVQVHGMSRPIDVPSTDGEPFYPHFVLRDFLVWVLLLGGLALLATLIPWDLGEKADPLAPAPAGLKPEWYFLFMYQALRMLPARLLGLEGEKLGVLVFVLAGAALILVPFLDVWAKRERRHYLFIAAGVVAVVFVIAMTVLGLRVSF
jgi:cytochrome b6